MKTAYLLHNIGTPASPTVKDVATYLNEFLTDPDVIPLPYLLRQLLVRGWIVPRRAKESAKKYQLIWTNEGSPLLVNARLLQKNLQALLPGPVLLAMQFGEPSLEAAMQEAMEMGVEKIVLIPLYPQYAEATSGGAEKKAKAVAKRLKFSGELAVFPSFPVADFFVQPLAKSAADMRRGNEFVLFTFHGLPESQVKKGAPGCLMEQICCDRPLASLPRCYRAQSFATARALAKEMNLKPNEWSVSFQSRLGRAKWITPYTEDVLRELPRKGIKNVLLVSPSFVSDCLETLEELGHQGKHTFLSAGGDTYLLAPCVNGNGEFADGLAKALTSAP